MKRYSIFWLAKANKTCSCFIWFCMHEWKHSYSWTTNAEPQKYAEDIKYDYYLRNM